MEKRVVFQNRWLPYLLVAPQLAITLIFFFLPAGQAIYQSAQEAAPEAGAWLSCEADKGYFSA